MRIPFLCILILLVAFVWSPSSAQAAAAADSSCALYTFSNNNRYANCNPLPVLDSFLHWTHHPSNNTVDLAYRHTRVTASNWVAWSLNPAGPHMIGSQSLVAFVNSTTGVPRPFTSPITGPALPEGPLSFPVPRIAAEFNPAASEMILYATIQLPRGRTNFTHLWQHGTVSRSGEFQAHPLSPDHLRPFANIDFATGRSSAISSSASWLRILHAVINVVSWGIMMPVGAMMARYVRVFEPKTSLWFHLHRRCQCLAYLLGLAGVGIGLYLGKQAHGGRVGAHPAHRYLGISVFALASVQVLSLVLRPKMDAKWRWLWNWYHRTIGYGTIVLSSVNIFLGMDMLDPGKAWRVAYTVFVAGIACVAVVLEGCSWVVLINRKQQPQTQTDAAASGEDAA